MESHGETSAPNKKHIFHFLDIFQLTDSWSECSDDPGFVRRACMHCTMGEESPFKRHVRAAKSSESSVLDKQKHRGQNFQVKGV